jgi:serine protease DegQ
VNTSIKRTAVSVVLILTTAVAALNVSAVNRPDAESNIPSLAPMLEGVTPAVVNIFTTQEARAISDPRYLNREDLRRFFENNEGRSPQENPSGAVRATGSGVIVDAEKGYIITNHHVIANASTIKISLKDGREFDAKLLGSDASTDVALLQIEAKDLKALQFADVERVRVGDYVLAIGNPFGIGQTVTSGIVSALGRGGLNRENYEDFIQTDAAINMGNSGGALIDLEGNLVGMNTAIISGNGSNAGIGFAVPADMISIVMGHLARDGEMRRGQLGVQIQDLTSAMESVLATGAGKGALVTNVMPDSAAEAAGIQPSDVIVGLNGHDIDSGRELRNAIGLLGVDKEIQLALYRDGRKQSVNAVIGGAQTSTASVEQAKGRDLAEPTFAGAALRSVDLDAVSAKTSGTATAVVVENVTQGSPAYLAGLRPGDIIYEVNKEGIKNLREFNGKVAHDDNVTALSVLRENRRMLVILS